LNYRYAGLWSVPLRGLVGATAAILFAACAPGRGAPAGTPVAEPGVAAAELRAGSLPGTPLQVTFEWSLDEAGSRIRGRGVARLEAPERIRLDLFGQRGETYLTAALVGDEFRVPAGVPSQIALPSPALLWAAVGVVEPPADARLVNATTTGAELTLRYDAGASGTLEYVASVEPLRLLGASRSGGAGARETLRLSYDSAGQLASTRYRDVTAHRELVLTVEATTAMTSFPANIWRPDVAAR
jgi:hypothetical protein